MLSFAYIFGRMLRIGESIIAEFSQILPYISNPPVEDGPLRDFLEATSWVLTPHLNQWIVEFFPGHFVDTIWDLTLIDWMFAAPVVLISFTFLKWILGLIRG